jgi:dTDP-4-dehydrorhamnose 3,5-epimerase
MIFQPLPLKGAYTIELDRRGDDRGFFARLFCEREFLEAGLESHYVQINNSLSAKKGTLRGLHYQLAPSAEVKVIRCIQGELFDVILDLRPDSLTFGRSIGVHLTANNREMIYVPRGYAHGLITLTENTEALYLVSSFYAPDCERGIRWNDPRFAIKWPVEPAEISSKDLAWPDFDPQFHGVEMLRGF